jgi:integrase
VLSIEDQDAILDAIPEAGRGIFVALALLGLRPGEARALDAADNSNGWLTVDKAVKGSALAAPIRGTKTGRGKTLPVPATLADWIARYVPREDRLRGAPLFVNPRTGRRWSHWALRDRWVRAAKSVGLEGARLYEGTKHTMATDAVRRGVTERELQAFLGHKDPRSTRRYTRMSREALIHVLRPSREQHNDLSRTCPAEDPAPRNPAIKRANVASPTGLEPLLFGSGI